ncbi:acyltransferase family-domain-containing protein [Apiospora arundinis]|uniref:Acyltransferase family-domain-containing protein n=1 Tax=Apiospora arundinis TaxID=335852 RepID=A0ABR2IWC3_9PEZI
MAYANSASFLSGGYHLLTARSSSSSSSDHDYSKESRSASLEDGLCESGAVGSTTSPRQWPWRVWFRRALRELSPSFFHPWIRRKQYGSKGLEPESEPKPISPTAWLDGLRGYAAFFVVWHHISLIFFSWSLHDGYAGRETDHLLQLPIVRLAISGPPQVFVFFVISGYALSYKPLKLLRDAGGSSSRKCRTQEKEETPTASFYAALASSAFRRHPRLFIPAIVMSLPVPLLAYSRWFGMQMPGAAVKAIDPTPLETLGAQFMDYLHAALELADPLAHRDDWTWDYNTTLWTLPHEFRGSLLVYGALLALSRCRNGVRMFLVAFMAAWALYFAHWPQFLFLSGMLLADLRLRSHRGTQEEEDERCDSSMFDGEWKPAAVAQHSSGWNSVVSHTWPSKYLQAMIQVTSYLCVLYVLSAPPWHLGGDKVPGYIWLAQRVPSQWVDAELPDYFWAGIAAVALIFILDRSPLLQRLFTTPFARYLGRVSYSLYLVHGPILSSFGWWLGKSLTDLTGPETDSGYIVGIAATVVVFWVVVIWAADLGWRFVDAPAVRFAAWAHRKVASR